MEAAMATVICGMSPWKTFGSKMYKCRYISTAGKLCLDSMLGLSNKWSLSYLYDQNVTQYCDTSTYRFDDIHFKNITGNGLATPTDYPGENITFAVSVICSKKAKCGDVTFQDVDISLPDGYDGKSVICKNAEVDGLECNVWSSSALTSTTTWIRFWWKSWCV